MQPRPRNDEKARAASRRPRAEDAAGREERRRQVHVQLLLRSQRHLCSDHEALRLLEGSRLDRQPDDSSHPQGLLLELPARGPSLADGQNRLLLHSRRWHSLHHLLHGARVGHVHLPGQLRFRHPLCSHAHCIRSHVEPRCLQGHLSPQLQVAHHLRERRFVGVRVDRFLHRFPHGEHWAIAIGHPEDHRCLRRGGIGGERLRLGRGGG
mmetsp:Transcript_2760/g.8227  ORF Transcript_2760/g.8227 Transcript_2760/m.8227 type:complete len:209 (+) Transcript_2760:821-1447(+)